MKRQDAVDKAVRSAGIATDFAETEKWYPANTWRGVAQAWADIARLMPEERVVLMADDQAITLREVTEPREHVYVQDGTPWHDEAEAETTATVRNALAPYVREGYLTEAVNAVMSFRPEIKGQRILNDLTEDELDTIAALRAGTAVVTPRGHSDSIETVGEVAPGFIMDRDTITAMRAFLGLFLDGSPYGSVTLSVKGFVRYARSEFRVERQDEVMRLVATLIP